MERWLEHCVDAGTGRREFFSTVDFKYVQDAAKETLITKNIEIEIVSFSSKKASKNIQLVFKNKKTGEYCTFEEIVGWNLKPENFTVMMGDKENELKAENATGSYHPSGNTAEVEHSFKDSPIFVCRNDEYGGVTFATSYPNAGFMKIHCKDNFVDKAEFTVSISAEKVEFIPATKTAGTFK